MQSSCGATGGRKRRGSRKMRGGNFYGMGQPIATGVPAWDAVENTAVTASGTPIPEAVMPATGGRRRRTGKKATRKGGRKSRASRRHARRRRTMRGGAAMYNSANVGYGFAGTGAGGLANQVGYPANAPAGGTQVNGVWQA